MRQLFLILTIFLMQNTLTHAQSTTAVMVDSIVIVGNQKTKRSYMLREMTFQERDTIPLSILGNILETNRLRLLNTSLFVSVKLNVNKWQDDNHVTVTITCLENWYFYPIPIFELADRNFNVWWTEMKRDLSRTNYGMRLTYNNATGRRDPLSVQVQAGYTPRYSISYSRPYINKKQNIGFDFAFSLSNNREVGYAVENNKLLFYSTKDRILLKRLGANIGFSYTPGLFVSHSVSIGYSKSDVDTAITTRFNKDYYLDGSTTQQFFYLSYSGRIDKRDFRPYPLSGYMLSWGATKNGFFANDNLNILDAAVRMAQYFTLNSKFSLEMIGKVKTAVIRNTRPFTSNRGLGFGSDNVRGYELYIADGLDYAYSKNSLRFSIIDKEFDWTRKTKKKWLKPWFLFPVKAYMTFNFDAGIANDPTGNREINPLSNRVLYGGGVGLDFLLWNSISYRFEYSVNDRGEKGVFFNYNLGF